MLNEKIEAMIADAKLCNSAWHDEGWYEMSWKAMDAANKVKARNAIEAKITPQAVVKTSPRQRQIMQAIANNAITSRSIAALLGVSSSLVAGHANHMESKGLLRILVGGKPGMKRRQYYLTDAGRAALAWVEK